MQFKEEYIFELQPLRELTNPSHRARSSRAFGGHMKSTRRSAGGKGGAVWPDGVSGSSDGGNGGVAADPYEKLEYMSDLILQLKRMAEGSGLSELAGALAAAHEMARNELKAHGGN